jgi:glycosyltransferase involved in cell wall biosynthesis
MKRRPKIVVASSGLGHVARGVESWADDLAAALAARDADVELCKGGGKAVRPYERVLPCWQREARPTRRLLRLLPRRVSWRLGLESPYGVEQVTFGLALIRHLQRHRVDLLHVQDPTVAIMAERARRLGMLRTRTILAHGTEESADFQRRITFLQHLAPWHLNEARAAGIARPHWAAIPNFIDTERFTPDSDAGMRIGLGLPAHASVILCVAAIKRHHKRIDHLLSEFATLRRERPDLPAWLVIAGGWEPETDHLVEEGNRLLGDRVRFLVRFPRNRMQDLYRAADLFVLTSLKEMMPVALLEASASGLPCLVHRHPVLQWMIGPGGEAIDMEAAGTLAAAFNRWLSDKATLRNAGAAAREPCVRMFGQRPVLDQILTYYEQVLNAALPDLRRERAHA